MILRAAAIALLLGLAASPAAQAQAQAQIQTQAQAQVPTADTKSAETFVRTLYSSYKAKGHPIALASPKAATILEASLAALVKTDEKLLKGEVGALEADPICSCQDYDIRSVDVSVTPDGADKAKATARFKNLDSTNKIDFDLVAVGGGWRIYDIHEADMPSLRKALEDEIAMIKTENAKEKKHAQ